MVLAGGVRRRPGGGRGYLRPRRGRLRRGGDAPLPGRDGGAGGLGAAVVLPVPAGGGPAFGPDGGRGPDGAAPPGRPAPASGPGTVRAADRLAGFVVSSRAAGPGDHLVHGPAGAAGQ